MTKNLYLFKANGSCSQKASFAFEDVDLDEYTRLNNAASYILSEENMDIQNLKLVNGEMQIVEDVSIEIITIEVLAKRNGLLAESDWTDTVSAKIRLGEDLYSSWQTYRQSLRDITKQTGYPRDVVWSNKPV
jgi:hypothetical protein